MKKKDPSRKSDKKMETRKSKMHFVIFQHIEMDGRWNLRISANTYIVKIVLGLKPMSMNYIF